ncbi:insulinase family protein [Marinobacter confluentis]|uniref:Protease 3 n=1 Tax=Marinobacter confluentis TaxID=1697557 RepID=A0A4Z1BZZ8_9GAMM|nr:peptidase M16 [Marinobacter confluentis]
MTRNAFHLSPARLAVRFTGLALMLLLITSQALAATSPIKSPNDDNAYRYLNLENDLRVLLISSPESDKAAASMNVAVGSGDDPADREGLSHFLEHMLFLGTEKYPDPGEYQQFIKSHGGSHNAFTAFRDTNYFFDIQAEHLDAALDRFAEQFAAPLFTPELVDRERNAVHSEFSAKQKEDGRRFYSVKKAISNPDHPFSQFAVGNLTTLENTEERPLRPDLIDFWKTHYSSNLMTLAVYGPQTLDELEAMVESRFNRIENRQLEARTYEEPLLAPGTLPAKLRADALKDIRSLSLSFPIPSQQPYYRNKPVSYVANLLGHEGPGSLFDQLKQAGLVESLSAGSGMDTGTEETVEISMSLTPAGLESQDRILGLTFAYIDKVREQGISERRFQEMKQLAQIDFRFRENQAPISKVTRLSMQMPHVAPEDVLQAPWMMENFAPDQYRAILARLTPDNVLVSIQEPDPGFESPRKTRWYDAEYALEPLDTESITRIDDSRTKNLALPMANPFIPEDLGMIAGSTMAEPVSLGQIKGMDVWYARDTRFETPKANVFLGLRTEATRASARSNVLSSLLLDAIRTNLNAWAYPAQLAGLDYSIYPHLRGVTIRVGGYNDKLHTLMTRILTQIADPTLKEQRFDIARKQMIDGLLNKAKNRPVEQTSEFIQTALIEGTWSTEDKLAAARSVTFEELQSFAEAFLAQVDPVLLAHGNMTQASALNLAQQINALVLRQNELTEVARSQVRPLPAEETVTGIDVDHPDIGYTLYAQGDNTSFGERATYRLLAQIVASPFYEEIRTNQQLGYIVYAMPYEILEMPALGFVVQSPGASANEIDAAVQGFSKTFMNTLSDMKPADIQREKEAVISKLLERDRQLGEISQRYWQEIDRGETGFDSRERLADAIRKVSRQDLMEAFQARVVERSHAFRVFSRNATGAEQGQGQAGER